MTDVVKGQSLYHHFISPQWPKDRINVYLAGKTVPCKRRPIAYNPFEHYSWEETGLWNKKPRRQLRTLRFL